MKRIFLVSLTILLIIFTGCSKQEPKDQTPPPKSDNLDTTHLTTEDRNLKISVSKKIRSLNGMNIYDREGYDLVSVQVAVENHSKEENIPISPDFVTLKTSDGSEYKYSPSLTQQITNKAAFKEVVLPPDYRGGGLLLFELKTGSITDSLTYEDESGHTMTVKFPSNIKTSV